MESHAYFLERERLLCKSIVDYFGEIVRFAYIRNIIPVRSPQQILREIMVMETRDYNVFMELGGK
jgi:hypothetical protein